MYLFAYSFIALADYAKFIVQVLFFLFYYEVLRNECLGSLWRMFFQV